jgi:hypothetical protein
MIPILGNQCHQTKVYLMDPKLLFITFQKNDPFLAVVVSLDVVAGNAAVVAGHIAVVEELPLQPVLGLVAALESIF